MFAYMCIIMYDNPFASIFSITITVHLMICSWPQSHTLRPLAWRYFESPFFNSQVLVMRATFGIVFYLWCRLICIDRRIAIFKISWTIPADQ